MPDGPCRKCAWARPRPSEKASPRAGGREPACRGPRGKQGGVGPGGAEAGGACWSNVTPGLWVSGWRQAPATGHLQAARSGPPAAPPAAASRCRRSSGCRAPLRSPWRRRRRELANESPSAANNNTGADGGAAPESSVREAGLRPGTGRGEPVGPPSRGSRPRHRPAAPQPCWALPRTPPSRPPSCPAEGAAPASPHPSPCPSQLGVRRQCLCPATAGRAKDLPSAPSSPCPKCCPLSRPSALTWLMGNLPAPLPAHVCPRDWVGLCAGLLVRHGAGGSRRPGAGGPSATVLRCRGQLSSFSKHLGQE